MPLKNSAKANDSPIAIIGGGCVGLSCALLLAQHRLPSLVIDPTLSGPRGRKLALNANTIDGLSQCGLWPALESAAVPIQDIHVQVLPHFPHMRLTHPHHGKRPLGQVVRIETLYDALLAAVKTSPYITLTQGELTEIAPTETGVQLTLADQKQVSVAMVIGADGAHSFVRTSMGIHWEQAVQTQKALVCEAQWRQVQPGRAYEYFTSSGAVAVLPLPDKGHATILTAPNVLIDALSAKAPAEVAAFLSELIENRLGRMTPLTPFGCYPLRTAHAPIPYGRGCVLIGDASQMMHPIAAQGFNFSFWQAQQLAECLRQAQAPYTPKVFSEYAQRMRPQQQKLLAATTALARTMPPICKAMGLQMLKMTPFAKTAITRWGMGDYS